MLRLETRFSSPEWNPVVLTKTISRLVGEVKSARVFHSGGLLIFCRDSAQLGKAIRLNTIEGKKFKQR